MYCINCQEEKTLNNEYFCIKCLRKEKNSKKSIYIGITAIIVSIPLYILLRIKLLMIISFVGIEEIFRGTTYLSKLKQLRKEPERHNREYEQVNNGEINEEALNRYLQSKQNIKK